MISGSGVVQDLRWNAPPGCVLPPFLNAFPAAVLALRLPEFLCVFISGKHPREELERFLETIYCYAKLFAVKAKELDAEQR
jgi:hypothetical protein